MQPSRTPIRTVTDENAKVLDNSELVKRMQSVVGKIEGFKNELSQVKSRLAKLEGEKQIKLTNAVGKELITENS